MAHRMAHLDDKVHLDNRTLTRIQSAVIIGSIGSGLLACALGSFIYDMWQVVAGK
jgi:hypothetical protein